MLDTRSPAGFDKLADRYAQELDRFAPEAVAEALDAAGLRYGRGDGGRMWLEVPGVGQIGFAQAVRLRLINLSS